MEELLEKANNNIEELIDGLCYLQCEQHKGNCLRVVLLNKERKCLESCDACNETSLDAYKKALMKNYIVTV